VKYKEVAQKLKQMGCQEIPRKGSGSHRKWYNPEGGAITPIPDWGSKDLKIGTLRQIIHQFKQSWGNFIKIQTKNFQRIIVMSHYVLQRIQAIQDELETLKKIVESESQNTSKVVNLKGLWKGIDITDQDLMEAKNSVFRSDFKFD
jgi:hypothetical protein